MSETKTKTNSECVDLACLAARINAGHEECLAAARTTLENACAVGQLLLQAKAAVEHGKWSSWIEANCRFAIREAQRYMKVARSAPLIKAQDSDLSKMTLTEAIELLSNGGNAATETNGGGETATDEPFMLPAEAIQEEWSRVKETPVEIDDVRSKKIQKWVDQRCNQLFVAIRKYVRQSSQTGKNGQSEDIRLAMEILRRFKELVRVEGLFPDAETPDAPSESTEAAKSPSQSLATATVAA